MASPLLTYAGIALISASALVLAWLATTGRWQSPADDDGELRHCFAGCRCSLGLAVRELNRSNR